MTILRKNDSLLNYVITCEMWMVCSLARETIWLISGMTSIPQQSIGTDAATRDRERFDGGGGVSSGNDHE